MTMTIQEQNAPTLRFPEFNGEWEEYKLRSLGTFKSGIGFSETEQGGLKGTPFLKVSDMNLRGNETEITVANNYVTENQIKHLKYKPITDNAIIFAKVGAAIFLERKRRAKNFLIDNNMMAFIPRADFSPKYASVVFGNLRLSKYAQVGALPSYNGADLATIRVHIPKPIEQQKIASFLSSVNIKLEQLGKKKTLLKQYKKGMMQKLFSQEIRFKSEPWNDYPDWEEKRLGEIAKKITTKNRDNALSRVLTNSAIKGVLDQGDYFDKDIANHNNLSGYYIVKKYDYVYNPRISQSAPVGPINKNELGDGVMSPLYTVFRFDSNNDVFYKHLFSSSLWHHYMYTVANYGARHDRMNITANDFIKMPLPVPCREEQQKITNFLSAIDQKIELVGTELKLAKTFKKGLLQQMFI